MRVRTYGRDEAVPFHSECLVAAEDLGWRMASDLCDLDANDSFGLESVNVVGTTRWNTSFAYLDPVRDSGSLRIVDHTLVDRIESTARRRRRIVARRLGEPIVAARRHGGAGRRRVRHARPSCSAPASVTPITCDPSA